MKFSPIKILFYYEVVQKLKFPNNSIIYYYLYMLLRQVETIVLIVRSIKTLS